MAVYKDADGKWRFRKVVRLANGQKERISGTPNRNSRTHAEEAERQAIDRLEHPERYPDMAPPKAKSLGFAEFAQTWLETYVSAKNKSSTKSIRDRTIELHLIPYWGDTPLEEIDDQKILQFVGVLRETDSKRNTLGIRAKKSVNAQSHKPLQKLSANSIYSILGCLHTILASALEWGKLQRLPRFPRIHVPRAKWDWLTRLESGALLATIEDAEELAIITFAIKTGARLGEQLAIMWDDIDWHNKSIHIRRQFHRGRITTPKSGKERIVHLAPSLEALLKGMERRGKYIFCDKTGKPHPSWRLQVMLRRRLRKAGLRHIRWHDLRHTFASQLVQAGVNLRQVQEWCGHANIMQTMKYSHLAPTEAPRLIALLDDPTPTGKEPETHA